MATHHTDPHLLPHCGQCMLNFETYEEQQQHKEDVTHEVIIEGSCSKCGKENIRYKEVIKQVQGIPPTIYCDDCLAKLAALFEQRKAELQK